MHRRRGPFASMWGGRSARARRAPLARGRSTVHARRAGRQPLAFSRGVRPSAAPQGEHRGAAGADRRAGVAQAARAHGGGRRGLAALWYRHYPLALAWLDSGVVELMDFLRANRLDRNTLTVFTSDHAAFDEGHCYQGGSRVPLLMRWPAAVLPRGAPLPHPVSHLDLLPTLLHATNARLPGEPAASGGGGGGALRAVQLGTR